MAEVPTLNSRLRVLIAKTFRAEKLFSSIRNTANGKTLSASQLSDIANDLRAREWQRAHTELRSALNEIVGLPSTAAITAALTALGRNFQLKFEIDRREVDAGVSTLTDCSCREEFAQVARVSLDLIRAKARAQVHKAIADEIGGILGTTGREELSEPFSNSDLQAALSAHEAFEESVGEARQEEYPSRAKILQLKPKLHFVG